MKTENMMVDREIQKIQPIRFQVDELMTQLIAIIQQTPIGQKPEVLMPVSYPRLSRFNKVRFTPKDKTSPMGIVVRDDIMAQAKFPYYMVARFDAHELYRYIALKVSNQVVDQIEEKILQVESNAE